MTGAFSGEQTICLHLDRWGLPGSGDREREYDEKGLLASVKWRRKSDDPGVGGMCLLV